MSARVIVPGTLRPDGTLELDQKPNLAPGRVRVTVETVTESTRPHRFWSMMQLIWADLQAAGHIPRTREQIDAEINALREEDEERLRAVERLHEECRRAREQAPPDQGTSTS
jgi:hypothetical protein